MSEHGCRLLFNEDNIAICSESLIYYKLIDKSVFKINHNY
jgi:hypothetical protein